MSGVLGALPVDDAERRLQAAGIACGRVRDAAEAAAHPQFAARGRWQDVGIPGGTVAALAAPWTLDGAIVPMGSVPALGQHTEEILAELQAL